MDLIENKEFSGERALYNINDKKLNNVTFKDGESPLKECKNLELYDVKFEYYYPLWYGNNFKIEKTKFDIFSRAGIWYSNNVVINNSVFFSPKNIRKCNNIELNNVDFDDANEALWASKNIKLKSVVAKGEYFCMNSSNIDVDDLTLFGKYAFDGVSDVVIRNSIIETKDSFWNSKNVKVYDSVIKGEYIGWNSEKLEFYNCKIESHQGFCYINNLKLVNCEMENSDLCFERVSNIDAEIKSDMISIKNPYSGIIKVNSVKEIIMDKDIVDDTKTKIITLK